MELPAIEAPANPPTNAILRVRMFSSVSCWEIPQARTAARAELGPRGVNRVVVTLGRPLPIYPDKQTFLVAVGMSQTCHK
jgi:hypothetical protein